MQSFVGISKQEPAHLARRRLHGLCLHQKGGCSVQELAGLEEGAELAAALKKICRSDPEQVPFLESITRAGMAKGGGWTDINSPDLLTGCCAQ